MVTAATATTNPAARRAATAVLIAPVAARKARNVPAAMAIAAASMSATAVLIAHVAARKARNAPAAMVIAAASMAKVMNASAVSIKQFI
jgi:hypothetical protein